MAYSNTPQGQAPLRPAETIWIIGAAVGFLLAMFAVILMRGSAIFLYVQDPAAVFGFSPLAGFISNLGVFALFAAGAICVFASYHVPARFGLLFWAGALSVMIAADDFFMFHEFLAPRIGVPEIAVFGFYAVYALGVIVVFRTALAGRAHVGLYAAAALLAASVGVDLATAYSQTQVVFEDSLKFVGLILWAAYWVRRAHLTLAAARAHVFAPEPVASPVMVSG